jgi:hypothetical protein
MHWVTNNTGWTGSKADQISWGIFLIGVGLMFAGIIAWWPGILFVGGFASLASALAQRKQGWALLGGAWLIGLGLLFSLKSIWPIVLVIFGASMLYRTLRKQGSASTESDESDELDSQIEKVKRDKLKNSDPSGSAGLGIAAESVDDEDISYMLGDDGELIPVKPDHKTPRAR